MTDVTLGLGTKASIGIKLFSTVKDARNYFQEQRVIKFFNYVELRYEHIGKDGCDELNKYVNSSEGKSILTKFSDSILETSSERGSMALAFVFCDDPDFSFSRSEKEVIVSAIKNLDDDMIDFFVKSSKLKTNTDYSPYPITGITSVDFDTFKKDEWDSESVFVYVNELIRLRLLLPDPVTSRSAFNDGNGWGIWFGVTERSRKMASLFEKAELFLTKVAS